MAHRQVRENVERILGKHITDDLYTLAQDVAGTTDKVDAVAAMVLQNYSRDPTFPLTENLIISMLKYAVEGSKNLTKYDTVDRFIRDMVGVDDAERKLVSDSIFLSGYLDSNGIRIFRY